MILSLFALVIRIAILAAFTFAFVVLYENGPENYVEGAKKEWATLVRTFQPEASGANSDAPGT